VRVLVTGATTPLGLAIVDALLATADTELVLAIGRESNPPTPTASRLVYRSADLTHPRVLHDLLWGETRERAIDVVIHAMQHRASGHRGAGVHAQNVDVTRSLVLACEHHPTIRRFVYRSFSEVYALHHTTSNLIDEESPLDFTEYVPQWIRDRVEADVGVCAHLGGSPSIAVLRCAEILAPSSGSQLLDYLQSRVCLRPLGFDPMVNVLSVAFVLAARSTATGIFNIPGFDTLPLSSAIAICRRADIPVPGPMMSPLYALRRWVANFEFRYEINAQRFHFGGVLDGTRARTELGYVPHTAVSWPQPWWALLVERLRAERAADAS